MSLPNSKIMNTCVMNSFSFFFIILFISSIIIKHNHSINRLELLSINFVFSLTNWQSKWSSHAVFLAGKWKLGEKKLVNVSVVCLKHEKLCYATKTLTDI